MAATVVSRQRTAKGTDKARAEVGAAEGGNSRSKETPGKASTKSILVFSPEPRAWSSRPPN